MLGAHPVTEIVKLEVDRLDAGSVRIHLVQRAVGELSVTNVGSKENLLRVLRPSNVAPIVDRVGRSFLFVDVLLFCRLWIDDRDGVLHEVIADPSNSEFGTIGRPGKDFQPHVSREVLNEFDDPAIRRDNSDLVINRRVAVPHSGNRNHRRAVLREVHHLMASHFGAVTPNYAEVFAGRGELELLNAGARLAKVGELLRESCLSIHSEDVGSV